MGVKRLFCTLVGVILMVAGVTMVLLGSGAVGESAPMNTYDFIKAIHPDPFRIISEAEFAGEAKRLDAQWDALLESGEAGYALMRLAASLGDEHTRIAYSRGDDYALPFYVMRVEGRCIIVQAQRAIAQLAGKELTAIGGVSVDELYARVLPYLSGETEGWLGVQFVHAICSARLLMHVGAAQEVSQVTVTARDIFTGEEIEVTADTLWGGYDYSTAQIMPLAQTLMQSGYYYATLLEQGEVFIQYNTCAENPQMPMEDFAQAILAQIGPLSPKTVIVDLRHNGGGNSEVINPLLDALSQMMESGSAVYALIGPETFSSGAMNALDLRDIGAALVGEATGGVMGFGEIRSIPVGDGMTLYCSSKDFSGGTYPHEPVYPDETVIQTAADFAQGIDSAIAWIRGQNQ